MSARLDVQLTCGTLRRSVIPDAPGRLASKKQRNINTKIKVVAAHTLTIPPEHERELPAVAVTKIPREWKGKSMIFVPFNYGEATR